MKKEIIPLDGIKEDLCGIIGFYTYVALERFSLVAIPFAVMAVIFGFLARINLSLGLSLICLCAIPVAIGGVRFVRKLMYYKRLKKTVLGMRSRADLSISVERLDRIKAETIFEPWSGRRTHSLKEAHFYDFASGKRWRRVVGVQITPWRYNSLRYYEWSRDFALSPVGLDNISLEGDEFLYVCLRDEPEVACIYPAKYFVLDESV